MTYSITDKELNEKKSAFPPLSEKEKTNDWAKEFIIGQSFARELDFYRAISTYKRALILLGSSNESRQKQIAYNIVLCYYLAKRYQDVINTFETSDLLRVDSSFYAYYDLLTLLYESYQKIEDREKAAKVLALIKKKDPEKARKLRLYSAISNADISFLQRQKTLPAINQALHCYCMNKKNPSTARMLNALLPGAGFYYLGQNRSALTAFFLNGLFIAATVKFFQERYYAAGIITLSFESGWYFGGIYGAQEETKLYNERLYERVFCPILNQEKYFPVFMLNHTF